MTVGALDLVAMDWQRVQLVIRLRGTASEVATLTGLGLTRIGRSRETMAATNATPLDDGLVVRFNVMAGPRRRPLDPGAWTLTSATGSERDAVRLRVNEPGGLGATRSFRLARSRYDATAAVDPDRGTLELAIGVDPFDGRDPARWPRWRVGRRSAHAILAAGRRASRGLFTAAIRSRHRRTGRRIVFATAARSGLTGNLKVVRDRMIERGLGADYDLITLHQAPPATGFRRWPARWRQIRLLLGAEAILVAGSRQRAVYGIAYDPDARFIQLWHASGAFKTVGYSRVGRALAPSPYDTVHKDYTHAIVSSDHDVPFYAEAFGIPESRVVPTGIPRMDRFFDEGARAAGRTAALAAFGIAEGRTVWLFAPTFRGDSHAATYDYGRIDFAGLHALAVEKDAVVIFKMHPFVREPVPIPEAMTDRLIDGTRTSVDVNDLLFAVDLLITDYSSILFEYSVLQRPMLFFAYDLDEYVAERDFYVPFEEFVPGRIVRSFAELLDAIDREDYEVEKVGAFVRAHFAHLDAGAADRVIDELVLAR
jgi:CDP-ribitol ribitolphosphotransferase